MATVTDVEVVIKADITRLRKQLTDAEDRLNKFRKETGRSTLSVKKLGDGFRNAASSAAIMEGPLGKVAGRLSSIGAALRNLNPAAIAFGVSSAAVAFTFTKAASAAGTLEQKMLRLEGVVKATGGASGFTAKQMNDMAVSLDRNTLASADTARQTLAMLTTFKTIGGSTFPRVLELSQDMATVMGSDLTSAARQLARALDNPREGLTALTRSGVTFTEGEKEVIRALFDTGEVAKAQGIILDKVAGKMGGAAKTEAQGLSGAVDGLSLAWTQLLEEIGKGFILDSATISVKLLAESVEALQRGIVSVFDTPLDQAFNDLVKRREDIKDILEGRINIPLVNKDDLREELEFVTAKIKAMQDEKIASIKEAAAREAKAEKLRQEEINARVEQARKDRVSALQNSLRTQEEAVRQSFEKEKQLIVDNVRDNVLADELIEKSRAKRQRSLEAIEGTAENVAKKQATQREKILDGLQKEIDLLNLSDKARLRYNLTLQGASNGQIVFAETMQDSLDEQKRHLDMMGQLKDASEKWGDSLVDAAVTGKFSFKDFATSVIQDMARMAIKRDILAAAGGKGGSGGDLLSMLATSALGMFGGSPSTTSGAANNPMKDFVSSGIPGLANGGVPAVGAATLVGERGPELFVPKVPGTVVPAGQTSQIMSGNSTPNVNQTINIDAKGATPGMEAKIRQAVVEGAKMGYEMVAQDFTTAGPLRRALG